VWTTAAAWNLAGRLEVVSEGGEGSGDENVMRSNSLASNGSRSNSVDDNRQQFLTRTIPVGNLVEGGQTNIHSRPDPSVWTTAAAPRPVAPGPLIVDGSVRPSEPRSAYASDLVDPYSRGLGGWGVLRASSF
jgi:hypothetical protein